jgi:hypothetical protein
MRQLEQSTGWVEQPTAFASFKMAKLLQRTLHPQSASSAYYVITEVLVRRLQIKKMRYIFDNVGDGGS